MPKNIKTLIVWLLLGAIGLATFILLFNQAFPVASIDIKLGKEQVLKKAEGYVKSLGFDLKGFDKAIIFDSDEDAAVYLQKNLGIKKSNEVIRKEIPVWFWSVRWFKELQKDGFWVYIDPATGDVVSFYHTILEDEKGANLSEPEAQALAQKIITNQGLNLNDYELKDNAARKRKNRTDYNFRWEKKGYKINEATLSLHVSIYGDKLGEYSRYLKVPETFNRDLEKETSLGTVLTMISGFLVFLLMIATIVVLILQFKKDKVNWKFGWISASIVAFVTTLALFNSMSLMWIFYPDTVSKAVFMMIYAGGGLLGAILVGMAVFIYGAAGESLSRDLWPTKTPLVDAIRNRSFKMSEIAPIFAVGYSLAFIFLGYLTLFYLIGTKFFHIWMPAQTNYSNILGTSWPFLFPLTIALAAAFNEEFTFRLFAMSFLKKYVKLTSLAVIIPAIIWAFAHSTYPVFPVYARGIELTFFGIALGLVFLKYGLETVIICHFVVDALLVGLPLLQSHNPYFITSGLIVLTLAFSPLLFMGWARKKAN